MHDTACWTRPGASHSKTLYVKIMTQRAYWLRSSLFLAVVTVAFKTHLKVYHTTSINYCLSGLVINQVGGEECAIAVIYGFSQMVLHN